MSISKTTIPAAVILQGECRSVVRQDLRLGGSVAARPVTHGKLIPAERILDLVLVGGESMEVETLQFELEVQAGSRREPILALTSLDVWGEYIAWAFARACSGEESVLRKGKCSGLLERS